MPSRPDSSGPASSDSGAARHPEPILHVDMDAFYASVEQHDDASLRERPVAVGSTSGRGVVAAASYEARAFGVRSAMPMVRARRLCPDLVVVPPRPARYQEVSATLMTVLHEVTPLVEPLSLDEAFLDVRGSVRLFGAPPVIGALLRDRVQERLGLRCSVGVGPTKSVAKLLSTLAKPDGLLHWPAAEVVGRLRPLDVGMLWGAGPRTIERLATYGFTTVGQIADADPATLRRVVGEALGTQLHQLARGVDPRPVIPAQQARSISAETTFEQDVDDPAVLERRLIALATTVTRRLRRQELAARTVTVKLRLADHTDLTRSHTVPLATDRTHDLVAIARHLLESVELERTRVRLIGIRLSGLGAPEVAQQLTLVADPADPGRTASATARAADPDGRWTALDRAADAIVARFGAPAVSFAASLDESLDESDDATRSDEFR